MTTPEENEEQKLIQWAQSHPGFIGRLLGKLKLGVREKPSLKKSNSSRINAAKATEARKLKANAQSKSDTPPH